CGGGEPGAFCPFALWSSLSGPFLRRIFRSGFKLGLSSQRTCLLDVWQRAGPFTHAVLRAHRALRCAGHGFADPPAAENRCLLYGGLFRAHLSKNRRASHRKEMGLYSRHRLRLGHGLTQCLEPSDLAAWSQSIVPRARHVLSLPII